MYLAIRVALPRPPNSRRILGPQVRRRFFGVTYEASQFDRGIGLQRGKKMEAENADYLCPCQPYERFVRTTPKRAVL